MYDVGKTSSSAETPTQPLQASVENLINDLSLKRNINNLKKRNTSRQQSSIILHAFPVKTILEKKAKKRKAKECAGHKGSLKSKKKLGAQTQINQNIDTDNNICAACFEKFEDSRPGEQWIKCKH